MNRKENTLNIITASLFAALIMVFTAYVKVNTGINNGYLHFGDSMIYLASCFLPIQYAAGAAALGGALADILAGAAVWAPATAAIKAFNALVFVLIRQMHENPIKVLTVSSVIAAIVSGIVTVFGYLLAETLMYGFAPACLSVPFSIIQAVGSTVIFYVTALALDCAKFKKKIKRSDHR